MTPILLKTVSFAAGAALGILNYRLFVKSILGLSAGDSISGARKHVVKAGLFRHLFIFLAGIWLIRGASLAPFHLCGGLLLATFLCRIQTWRAQQVREE